VLKLGLLGYPATYSLSPIIFEAAFRAAGIEGFYKVFPTHANDLRDTIWQLAAQGYRGVNVTTPHKEAALRLAQNPSPDAILAGAANLLLFDQPGAIAAHNTDIPAIAQVISDIRREISDLDSAMVVGSSGAARAIIIALARDLGYRRITVAARDTCKLLHWVDQHDAVFYGIELSLVDWDEKESIVSHHKPALIINATTLGWHDSDPFPIQPDLLSGVKFVLDLNYPRPNRWLDAIRERHIPCRDGRMMLLWQAALGFEIFTGVKAPYDEMKEALEKETGKLDD
jgi:shikimate dehydrogenase